ncbi:MAG: TIGR01459 family HAD-type hydrolase [Pseudomonadota bacterium]
MAQSIDSLVELAPRFGAVVLDQWGVLHNGTAPYGRAVETVNHLHSSGVRLAVLSNSGKRAAPNAARIEAIGFDPSAFEIVMSSGEALWWDIAEGRVTERRLFAIERAPGDARAWAEGLRVNLVVDLADADAILLMGVPDTAAPDAFEAVLDAAFARDLPVMCTNPDRASPRAGGQVVASPGALAHAYAAKGGQVRFYGKPHLPVFRSLEATLGLPPDQLVMVGDSLEHDIAGAASAGWSSIFIRGGLHHNAFAHGGIAETIAALAQADDAPLPDFTLAELQ